MRRATYCWLPTVICTLFGLFTSFGSITPLVSIPSDRNAVTSVDAAVPYLPTIDCGMRTSTPEPTICSTFDPLGNVMINRKSVLADSFVSHPDSRRMASIVESKLTASDPGATASSYGVPENSFILAAMRCCCSDVNFLPALYFAKSNVACAAFASACAACLAASAICSRKPSASFLAISARSFASAKCCSATVARSKASPAFWFTWDVSDCRYWSICWFTSCSFRLFHQVLIPNMDSPTTPMPTNMPNTSSQTSNLPRSVSKSFLLAINLVRSDGFINDSLLSLGHFLHNHSGCRPC